MVAPIDLLQDVQLPAPVPWWPPAPGWWLLLLLPMLFAFVAFRRQHLSLRRWAEGELERLLRDHRRGGDAAALMAGISILLRRVALSRWGRVEVAALHGDAWLLFLDRTGQTAAFTRGAGRALAVEPYRPAPAGDDIGDVVRIVRRWLAEVA